ncbi:MAG: glycosyltransferase family 39 protein [Saprospiraceae bacterium]|nr:glycosyltransferase family 39 protein [Saprospiraceae bacterium]
MKQRIHVPEYLYLVFILLLAGFFAFYKLGMHPLAEFDESRNGVNAMEMLQHGHWLQLHYAGVPDTWNNKPPLLIWSIIASFKFFGVNALALRIPAALFILLSVLYSFKICTLYRSAKFAFWACLLLIPIGGFIGTHTGRTADFEAPLIGFLLGSTYYYLKYLDFGNKKGIFFTALFLGLAFLSKGPAMAIFIPGLILYTVLRGKFRSVVFDWKIYAALVLVALFPILYYYELSFQQLDGSQQLNRLVFHDVVERFTNQNFESPQSDAGYLFFFIFLDSYFNLWNYLFYLILAIGITQTIRQKISIKSLPKHPLLLLALCMWSTQVLFFTFAATTHRWYLAPILPFITITTMYGVFIFLRKPVFQSLILVLLLFSFGRRFQQINNPAPAPEFIRQNCTAFQSLDGIVIIGHPPRQNILLDLYFCQENISYIQNSELSTLVQEPGKGYLTSRENREQIIKIQPDSVRFFYY